MKGFWGISELIVNTRLPSLSTSQGERSTERTRWREERIGVYKLSVSLPHFASAASVLARRGKRETLSGEVLQL